MVRYLRRWNGRETRLTIGDNIYLGEVKVEKLAPVRKSRSYMSTERKYSFHTYDGKILPIQAHGEHRVIARDGGLVQLI